VRFAPVLPPRADQLREQIDGLERLSDVGALMKLMNGVDLKKES